MRSLVHSLAALTAVAVFGCSNIPVPPEYLGVLNGGPVKPVASVFPLTPDAATPFPSGTLTACSGTSSSSFGALVVAGGAAFAGGDVFVASGEGAQRFATDAQGCPTAKSGPAFATPLAPVSAVAISADRLWAAGSDSVSILGPLGDQLGSCPGVAGITSLAVAAGGGLVAANGSSSLTFLSATADGVCTAQIAAIVNADGGSFGKVRALTTDGSLVWVASFDGGVAQIQSGHRSADGTMVKIDMPIPALEGVCSIDAIAIAQPSGHVIIADDTCRKIVEIDATLAISVSSTPMSEGHAVRSFAPVPDSSRLLAVGVAPAATGSVIVFDVLSLP